MFHALTAVFVFAENGDPIPSEADEELFHSLLAKAGMHLANAEGDESLVHLDADALQVGSDSTCSFVVSPEMLLTKHDPDTLHLHNSVTRNKVVA